MRLLVEVRALPLRRSCACVGLSRAAWYAPPFDWAVRDAKLIAEIDRFVEAYPIRGFWKCSDHLRKQHPGWNPKRIYRVYKAMNLNLRRAAKRRLPKRERVSLYVPRLPDTVWSVDFMSDAPTCTADFAPSTSWMISTARCCTSKWIPRSTRNAWCVCSSRSNATMACRGWRARTTAPNFWARYSPVQRIAIPRLAR